jgi:isopentenyl-diphosphate Delta-isomerase
MEGKLNIIDEKENIIGEYAREDIHNQGLLHREIWVWFYNAKGEVIFQHRSNKKDTFANLLDATVNGHVEAGESYEDAAIRETKEETNILLNSSDIVLLDTIKGKFYDSTINITNNIIRTVYAYKYDGRVKDLQVEEGEGVGFEAWAIDDIFSISSEQKKKFVPQIFEERFLNIFNKIRALI